MSNIGVKIVFASITGLMTISCFQGKAEQLYDYQTGKVTNVSSQQSYADDRNYRSTAPKKQHFYSGNWSLTLGASVYEAPKFEGDDTYDIAVDPIFSIGKTGSDSRFSSRNDNMSFALLEKSFIRLGVVGKVLKDRDSDTSGDLKGLSRVKWGGEVGGFAEIYPLDWLRARAELRKGIRSHDAVTSDIAVDAYKNLTPSVQVSGGPRAFYATKDYFKTYYGVDHEESLRSGLKEFHPDSGWGAFGAGGAITWKATDKITTSVFSEYKRLTGDAGDSSLVSQRGDKNQFTMGISASYRFDFTLR
ncbi:MULTISPECIES: MipA/OmpV family protein [Bartonella]|uniref:Outer membrane protein n=1 Tax=Bartonella choladocola TaxID=2750995 RepID=A0A1U9MFZ3_9HYPH|nr:MipA/OmpV family protein [Bartonella choladocola]AQT46629.1 outer membrane protein [Bartonella choladocola]